MIKTIKNGVYPTMITPYTSDNKIDYDGVLEILDFYQNNGVDGIFAICQSSEIFFLSFEERLELLKFVVKNLPKGMNIVASGHTADDIDRQIYEAKAFVDVGIDSYVFIANRFCNKDEDDSVFLRNFEKACNSIPDTSFGVYECPYPYKKIMTPSLIKKCLDIGNLSFIKDTCCKIDMIREKLKVSEGSGLKIYNANGATLLDSLEAGCAGYSGVMANFHPEIYSWLCKNYSLDRKKAKEVAEWLSFASTIENQCYPVNAKYHMGLLGYSMSIDCRCRDASAFSESNMKEIRDMYEVEKRFKKQMGI